MRELKIINGVRYLYDSWYFSREEALKKVAKANRFSKNPIQYRIFKKTAKPSMGSHTTYTLYVRF